MIEVVAGDVQVAIAAPFLLESVEGKQAVVSACDQRSHFRSADFDGATVRRHDEDGGLGALMHGDIEVGALDFAARDERLV